MAGRSRQEDVLSPDRARDPTSNWSNTSYAGNAGNAGNRNFSLDVNGHPPSMERIQLQKESGVEGQRPGRETAAGAEMSREDDSVRRSPTKLLQESKTQDIGNCVGPQISSACCLTLGALACELNEIANIELRRRPYTVIPRNLLVFDPSFFTKHSQTPF